MTGTELAALRLALGVLRRGILAQRRDEIDMRDEFACGPTFGALSALAYAADVDALHASEASAGEADAPTRAIRARLALYLRAVLRADALEAANEALADYCDEDDMTAAELGRLRKWDRAPYFIVGNRLARPLWLDAPPHGGA